MNLVTSKRFDEDLKKLLNKNPKFHKKVAKCLNLIRKDLRYPSLNLHKLSGLENFSVSVDKSIRIIFRRQGGKLFLLRIGTHNEVY